MVKPKKTESLLQHSPTTLFSTAMYCTTETLSDLEATLHEDSASLEKVLQAILDIKASLEARINTVSIEVNLLRADHRKLTDRVSETKSCLSTLVPTV
ncbi:hypothetical protein NDU88_004876 [Pleurodeles waltl]|uniref:Uncharacterized protein n=1 Tax=Pleurodeles waltl TaxID=8319 RepID=A0AAV7UI96_PLEWA|nr:hypothetical protein NDU88_004876 [Pleurodeles waltl]